MKSMEASTIEIPKPQFELYERVIVDWNEPAFQTKIVRRWFDFDDGNGVGYWWYKVSNDERLYPETALSRA